MSDPTTAPPAASRLAPWWWPSTQAIVAACMFGLTTYVIALFAANPDLDKHVLFVSIATSVVVSGWGGIVGFFFGSSLASAKKDATILNQSKSAE